ncbi:MAG: hypothetical protein HYT49_01170 [Candidatus Wildermuthbacteria bacterium]|nr:hypothetical protein [Candidatus Wildermuthbacteria bacterium]
MAIRPFLKRRGVPTDTVEQVAPQTALERMAAERRAAAEDEEVGTARARRLEMEARRLELAAENPVDEDAQIEVLVSQQYLTASERKIEARTNSLITQFNLSAADKMAALVTQARIKRAEEAHKALEDAMKVATTATTQGTTVAVGAVVQQPGYALTINGNVVGQGQTQLTIPGGGVTFNPAPGVQGYPAGTQVALTVAPVVAGSTVNIQGAGRRGQTWVVTMDRDRNVVVTITGPARPAGGPAAGGAGGGVPVPTPTP